jgi:metallo-beta-lactamase family protein
MQIQFRGADRTVTGSCHVLKINGLRILLDLGLYQGPRDAARRINLDLVEDPQHIDAIILSHGHLDHCGRLPMAVAAGFKGPIYCTPATAAVARIVLLDSANIQVEDVSYMCRYVGPNEPPPCNALYTPRDIPAVLKLMRTVDYNTPTDIGNGVKFTFGDAGHILGSAWVLLEWSEGDRARTLLFTGDIGRYDAPILRDPQPVGRVVDALITESTYGLVTHGPMQDVEPQFLSAVRYCIQRQSRLIVPSFAVGRTQTMLWYLEKFISEKSIPQIPIFIDSPMGVEVSHVHSQFRDAYDDQTRAMIGDRDLFGLARVTFASTPEQSKQINTQTGPCVIIASSPTCEFGRVLHHLTISVDRPNDLVVFVGWIPPQTLGRRLQDGEKRVKIFDRWYDVKCQVQTIHGMSAHADGGELLKFLSPSINASTEAFVVHGEADQADGFAARLIKAGAGRALVPAMGSTVLSGLVDAPNVQGDLSGAAAGSTSRAISDGD